VEAWVTGVALARGVQAARGARVDESNLALVPVDVSRVVAVVGALHPANAMLLVLVTLSLSRRR
jgi:hypothetical protein